MHHPARRTVLAALASLAFATLAAPPGVPERDAHDIRAVIEAQLAAFHADDAERAFSYASPAIRAQFVVADYFLAMVRGSYPVVYRPQTLAFMLAEVIDGATIQRVRMTDRSGTAWIAIYRMQQQPDRSWRIDGCVLARDTGVTA